ncbi:hypothetical protein [Serratia grimesii]|uniref:hypothetical protein n=1 Tax=Serratia grimesii TaxID=82995 RepID=UPI0021B81DB2|nr:hypothetical protein [Serratia grimesii]
MRMLSSTKTPSNTFGFSLALSLPEERQTPPASGSVQAAPTISKLKRESLS